MLDVPMTVAETAAFIRRAAALLSDEQRHDLVDFLASNPAAGVVIQRTGGIRKLRWASSGRGKRGGARVIYYFGGEDIPLYLLFIYAKNEQSDLTETHRQRLRQLVEVLRRGTHDQT